MRTGYVSKVKGKGKETMANPKEMVDAEASKLCPKCNGERYRHDQDVLLPGRRDSQYAIVDPSRAMSFGQFIPLSVIICRKCGFVESYYVG
jgi:hypothetical protein